MKLTNTLSGKKEHFKELEKGKVRMYVCGITPYDFAHVGHGRCYVTFDVLYRLLTFLGYEVTYCRNFTDIDDKTINRAAQKLGSGARYVEISNAFIDAYKEDMSKLNCLDPQFQPRVTETIPEIIEFIQGLINAGKAYERNGDVYYDISTFADYGKLSKQKLSELQAGARVDVREDKKNPLDFALWKKEPEGEFFKSPWGFGRPGWHIECSAMAKKFLGEQIDIHGGGADLIFPHHENEIAQTEGLTNKQFATFWVHNGFVMVNKEKMSKSLCNFFTLRDIFQQFDPMVIRFYILNHHYRAPIDFSCDDIASLQKSYQRLCKFFSLPVNPCHKYPDEHVKKSPVVQKMLAFLKDDLNTPGAWGVLFESLDFLKQNETELCLVKQFIQEVFGLTLEPLPEKIQEITPEIQRLLDEREAARKAKDWARADTIRDQLSALGYTVQDKKIK